MQDFLLEYDTVPLGRRNDRVKLPRRIAELLEENYLFFTIVQKIEHRRPGYADDFEFVPVYEEGQVDFRLYRKNGYDRNSARISKGIECVMMCLCS